MQVKSAGRNQLGSLKPTQRATLMRYMQRLVPKEGPADTRAGELLRHAVYLCTTPIWQLYQRANSPQVLEAKYVLLAASDLWPVAEELKVPCWARLIMDVMIYSDREQEIAQLLGVVIRFVEHHTRVDAVLKSQ